MPEDTAKAALYWVCGDELRVLKSTGSSYRLQIYMRGDQSVSMNLLPEDAPKATTRSSAFPPSSRAAAKWLVHSVRRQLHAKVNSGIFRQPGQH